LFLARRGRIQNGGTTTSPLSTGKLDKGGEEVQKTAANWGSSKDDCNSKAGEEVPCLENSDVLVQKSGVSWGAICLLLGNSGPESITKRTSIKKRHIETKVGRERVGG